MRNKIEDLRNHLFEQLERLSDDESMKNPGQLDKEVQRAASITQIASVIIDTARAETEFLKVIADGDLGLNQKSQFFGELSSDELKKLTSSQKP